MKSLIVSRCHTDNFGDRIITKSMDHLFKSIGFSVSHADYSFVPYYSHIQSVNSIAKRIGQKQYIKTCSSLIEDSDALIIGGGELLSPGFYSCICRWNQLTEKYGKRCKKFLFGIGFVDGFNYDQVLSLGNALGQYEGIYLRDNESYNGFINTFPMIKPSKVHCIPDVVFSLNLKNETHKKNILMGVTDLPRIKKHNIINVNTTGELFEYYTNELKKHVPNKSISNVQIIYNTESDKKIAREFVKYLSREHRIELKTCRIRDENEFIKVVNSAEMVISPRMHACIIGCLCGTAVKPLIISKKMQSFHDSYLLKDVDFSALAQDVISAAEELYSAVKHN